MKSINIPCESKINKYSMRINEDFIDDLSAEDLQ